MCKTLFLLKNTLQKTSCVKEFEFQSANARRNPYVWQHCSRVVLKHAVNINNEEVITKRVKRRVFATKSLISSISENHRCKLTQL